MKTSIEQFKEEQAYNAAHQLFAPFDDEDMGERLPGMFRTEIEEDGHSCLNMIFDNGEHFVYDFAEQTMHHVHKIPGEFFIHKHLEKVIYDFIVRHGLQKSCFPTFFAPGMKSPSKDSSNFCLTAKNA